jgi:peptide/nickel transport system permease protein
MNRNIASLSQWQLIARRFNRHWLAAIALLLIGGLYTLAVFADSFAVNTTYDKDVRYIYTPPMLPKFSLERGFYADAFIQQVDPVTLKRYYHFSPDIYVPLGFFVRDYAYKLLGLFPTNIHFFETIEYTLKLQP